MEEKGREEARGRVKEARGRVMEADREREEAEW